MLFTFECPKCKHQFQVEPSELAHQPEAMKCRICGDTPPPDIMTAYRNVGKTMSELYGCCRQGEKEAWLPKEVRRK